MRIGNNSQFTVLSALTEQYWDVIFPPGDLLSDEPPLETDLHRLQMTLLIQCLEWLWRERCGLLCFR